MSYKTISLTIGHHFVGASCYDVSADDCDQWSCKQIRGSCLKKMELWVKIAKSNWLQRFAVDCTKFC